MSPNRTRARLSTEKDAAAERDIISQWYGDVPAERLPAFASADYLVGTAPADLVECKDRGRYHQRFMAREGYVVSTDKVRRVVRLAEQYGARPVLLVRVRIGDYDDSAIIRMDPRRIIAESSVKDFRRERGRTQRRDEREECYVVEPVVWEEWRSPTYRWLAVCVTCGNGPDGRYPDGSPSFRCTHPPKGREGQ